MTNSTIRCSCWSVTINNPTSADDLEIALARQKGWRVDGQLEGAGTKSGTPHYQLVVRTPQVRFSAVKRAFSRAHIEPARNPAALEQYCKKEDTRLGSLPVATAKYPSVSKYWELLFDRLTRMDKDNLDLDALYGDGCIRFYKDSRQAEYTRSPLAILDEYTTILILDGFHVECHACNPQVRQQWKLFSNAILLRTWLEIQQKDSETDRQTDSVQEAEVQVPVLDINNADDSASPQTSDGLLGQEHFDSEGSGSSSGSSDEEGSDQDCEERDCPQL